MEPVAVPMVTGHVGPCTGATSSAGKASWDQLEPLIAGHVVGPNEGNCPAVKAQPEIITIIFHCDEIPNAENAVVHNSSTIVAIDH